MPSQTYVMTSVEETEASCYKTTYFKIAGKFYLPFGTVFMPKGPHTSPADN